MIRAQPEGPTEIQIDVEVRYAETDQMGVVHHANYLVWFELARTTLCQKAGFHYRDIEGMGFQLQVTGAHLEYRKGARYGDVVRVACSLEQLASRGLTFAYRIFRDSTLLARGSTNHVWVDVAKGRACRIPGPLERPFRALLTGSVDG